MPIISQCLSLQRGMPYSLASVSGCWITSAQTRKPCESGSVQSWTSTLTGTATALLALASMVSVPVYAPAAASLGTCAVTQTGTRALPLWTAGKIGSGASKSRSAPRMPPQVPVTPPSHSTP